VDGFWGQARSELDRLTGPVDIVASGSAVAAAMTLGREHAGTVRFVLLVDPASGERTVSAADARGADSEWEEHEADRIRAMADEGVQVRVIAHSWVGAQDRRDPPLPLGHPVVAEQVQAALTSNGFGVRWFLDRSAHLLKDKLTQDGGLRRLLDKPATLKALDKPADLLRDLIMKAIPSGRTRDLLQGSWLGHPAHPALVQVPLGMFLSATVLDFLPGKHKHVTDVLIGLGVLASVPAALAGATDYSAGSVEQRRTGLVHALLNSAALMCYLSSLSSRVQGHRLAGKASGLAGLALTSASAALGGHLVYRQGMSVDRVTTAGVPQHGRRSP